jgi:hypothetical protein
MISWIEVAEEGTESKGGRLTGKGKYYLGRRGNLKGGTNGMGRDHY